MDVLIIMCIGILVGRFIMPNKAKTSIDLISLTCTFLLIFSMGVMLGNKNNFINELATLGFSSLIFFLVPTLLSIILVYILTKHFLVKKTKEESK